MSFFILLVTLMKGNDHHKCFINIQVILNTVMDNIYYLDCMFLDYERKPRRNRGTDKIFTESTEYQTLERSWS